MEVIYVKEGEKEMVEKGETDKNPPERLQTRHGPRCSCNSPRPAVANLVPFKTARIRKTARCDTTDTQHQTQKLTAAS